MPSDVAQELSRLSKSGNGFWKGLDLAEELVCYYW
jgi:hypothetical protein